MGGTADIADFALLLEYVAELPGIERLRYTTSHPNEFTQRLIEVYDRVPQLVNHLHLPVQHGSDRILMAMKRGYTAMEYKSTIRKLRAVRPELSLSSDFIVGFPGETEDDFGKMMQLIDNVGFDASFSFIFSPRPGTPAANDTNRNLLLFRDPTVDGLKTGHTDAAGYCLVATAKRDFPNLPARRLLAIVLGASSENARAEEAQKLLNWGYTAYDGIKLFEANQAVVTPVVWKGLADTVPLGRPQAIVVAVPQGQASRIKTQVVRPDPLYAPMQMNQTVATLKVFLDQTPLSEMPLLALKPVPEAGWFGRTYDSLKLWVR
jgi:hypothetical protein